MNQQSESRMATLDKFFVEMHAITHNTIREPNGLAGLRCFFETFAQMRGYDEEPAALPSETTLNGDQLVLLFEALGPLIADANRGGAFLNIWAVAGLGRNEMRNASILSWLFDPRGSHGRGSDLLNACLDKIAAKYLAVFPLPSPVTDYTVATEFCPLGDQSNRVDIVIDGPDFSAFVEVKVDAPEGPDQTKTYVELASRRAATMGKSKHAVIFLAPTKFGPISAPDGSVLRTTWAEIAEAIESVVRSERHGDVPDALLTQFAAHIRQFSRR